MAGAVLFFDQLTKTLARNFLDPGTSRPVFPPVFHLTLVENQGIAFGLFQRGDSILFIVITLSIGALFYLGIFSNPPLRNQSALGLILGGALGNWVDRIRVGAVIDFLDFRIWPVFNFADTAITIGVGILLLDLVISRRVS